MHTLAILHLPVMAMAARVLPRNSEVAPKGLALFVHGAMGQGNNLRSAARMLAEASGWEAWLGDLRNHGASPRTSGPHTLQAVATDVPECLDRIASGKQLGHIAVVGHSLGGRIALEGLIHRQTDGFSRGWTHSAAEGATSSLVLLDTSPGTLPMASDVLDVLKFVEALEIPVACNRRQLQGIFTQHGFSKRLATWASSNTTAAPDGSLRFSFDVPTLKELIRDYQTPQASRWEQLTQLPPWADVTLVVGDKGARWREKEAVEWLGHVAEHGPGGFGGGNGRVHVRRVDSGHWVHSEDPDGVARVLREVVARAEQRESGP